jgi:hypothetical protein
VAQLNVKLDERRLDALRRYARQRRTPVAWLIKDYVEYLLAGGTPVVPREGEAPTAHELAALAERGGAFDWLADEPDLYSLVDGEAVPEA